MGHKIIQQKKNEVEFIINQSDVKFIPTITLRRAYIKSIKMLIRILMEMSDLPKRTQSQLYLYFKP